MPIYRKPNSTQLVDESGAPVTDQQMALATAGYNLDKLPVYGSSPTLNTQVTTITPTAANGFGALPESDPYLSEYDQLSQQRYQESQNPIDAEAIRKQKLAQFQAEIDATNQIYSNLIAKAQVEGQGRMGQQRAIANRGGIQNSPRGSAQAENVATYNRGIESDIEARRQAQITAIMTEAQNRADAEIAKREEAKRLGADQYLSYLSSVQETKSKNASAVLKSLLAQELKLEDISPEQLQQIATSLRMSPDELVNVYKGELAQAEAATAEAEYERALKEGEFGLKVGELGLKQDQFGFEQEKFGAEFGLKEQQFGFDQQKFNAELGLKYNELNRLLNNDQIDAQYKAAQIGKIAAEIQEIGNYTLGENQTRYDAEGKPIAGAGVQAEQATPQAQAQTKANIDLISGLLGRKNFANAVAPSALGRLNLANVVTGEKNNVISTVEQLTSQLTLDSLIRAKAKGATFGALSEGELRTLAASASKIGTWAVKKDGQVMGYKTSEKEFRKELDKINNFAKLDYIYKGGNPEDVGATQMPDGTIWTTNNDGSKTQLLDNLPFNSAGNASASNQIKGTRQRAEYLQPIKDFSSYAKTIGSGKIVSGSKYHTGKEVDIDGKIGDPIRAFSGGKVIEVVDQGKKAYGKKVVIQDAQGNQYIYGHLNEFNVKPGQKIPTGFVIGQMGNTGNVVALNGGDGSHLHLEKRDKNGRVVPLA